MLLQGNLPMEKKGLTLDFYFFKGDLVFFFKSERLSFKLKNHIVYLKKGIRLKLSFKMTL